MALESLFDTPPPLVSKGNNDSDKPANNSLIEAQEESEATQEEEGTAAIAGAIPAEELEDGEIDDETEEEEKEEKNEASEPEELDPEERKRLKRRQKNKERRKRKKGEKRMQALQAWAMAMAAGELKEQEQDDGEQEDDYLPTEEEEECKTMALYAAMQDTAPTQMPERNFSPKKKNKPRKRQRAPSPSESDEEEYAKLLKKEMSRHKLRRKSSGESSSEERRERSPGMYDSGGETLHQQEEEEGSMGEDFEVSQRPRKKKRKKHKHHHRSKHSKSKPRREAPLSDDEDEDMPPPPLHHQHHQNQYQQLSEQDQQILMDQEMGKVHVPKTHLICKFYLENKCKKGLDCSYTHEGTIPKRPEQCKFYLQGFCSKGPLCMFLHQEYPCKYYHTGQVCYSAEKCRFSHGPLTEETRPLIDQMIKEQHGQKGRDSDQPPLLPSPEKPNVPFQRGNPGGKPIKANKASIPSLFDLDVKPVGEKGQKILEKERKGILEINSDRLSFYGASSDEETPLNHSGRPKRKGDHDDKTSVEPQDHHSEPSQDSDGSSKPTNASDRPPLLPTPSPPLLSTPSKYQQPTDESHEKPTGSSVQEKDGKPASGMETGEEEGQQEQAQRDVTVDGTTISSQEGQENVGLLSPEIGNTTSSPLASQKAEDASKAASKPVVEPPKSMPAKSKALFMRIQQNQLKTDQDNNERQEADTEEKRDADGDDNWYSSDEEDSGNKTLQVGEKKTTNVSHLTVKTEAAAHVVAPSAISPEASNRGPLLSSVLIANNKQSEAQSGQAQLPGPLASLFSQPSTTTPKAAPLPLNILDLVTKGTSSVQKSKNPQVQDLLAGILPKRTEDNYRLLECIKDPNLKDPREGRERKSKAGMLFRVLKWKNSEYSVSDAEERPSLPPIELTTPTEMKQQPVFPTDTDARTQAVVDAIKKVISEAQSKPSDPRSQRPADPRMPPQDPRGFQSDPRNQHAQYPQTQSDPRGAPRHPSFPVRGQPPSTQPGLPPPRPPGPGFMRVPMGQPSQSFPPRMPRPPQPHGAPTGFGNPRFGGRGARGPRPMRPEVRQRMPHRPPRPGLQPPFGSPPRGGPAQHERMPGPRGPRFSNARMPLPESAVEEKSQSDPPRDPRAAGRPGAVDPRLLKRSASVTGATTSDVDMRVNKDPRLARMQQEQSSSQGGFPGGPPTPGFAQQGAGDVDMRQMNSASGVSTYTENPGDHTRGRTDPRQAARAQDTLKDVDLRQRPPSIDPGGGAEESGMPLKDMFKGKDPTASPFL